MVINSRDGDNQNADDDVNAKIRKNAAHHDVMNKKKRTGMVHDSNIGRPCDTEKYRRKGFWASHVPSTSSKVDHEPKFGPDLDPGLKRDPTLEGSTRLKNQQWTTQMHILNTTISPLASETPFRTHNRDRGGHYKRLIPYVHRDHMMNVFEGYCPELDDSPCLKILQLI